MIIFVIKIHIGFENHTHVPFRCTFVFTRCGRRGFMQPPLIAGEAREILAKLLGVTFNNHLSFADHVRKSHIVARQRLYLLQLLKRQGLNSTCLDAVFKAIVLSTMVYAMPAFSGYTSLNQMLIGCKPSLTKHLSWGISAQFLICVHLLAGLTASFSTNQTLIHNTVFLPCCLLSAIWKLVLRARGHRFSLPQCISKLF